MNVQGPRNTGNYPDLAVAILAGGTSRRFGSDKTRFRIDPTYPTLIERTVSIARSVSSHVLIIGHNRYADLVLGVPIVPDDIPNRGPVGGISTALRILPFPRVLVLACDMPCLSLPLLRRMIERPTDRAIVVPRTDDGRYHPLHAIYARSVLPLIDQQLRTGKTAVHSIFDLVEIDAVSESELRAVDANLDSLFNMNTPADIERVRFCQTPCGT